MSASMQVTWKDVFWPNLVTDTGEINHSGMVRRMESFLGLMIPGSVALYSATKCCGFPHSELLSLFCIITAPTLFSYVDEHRAELAFERAESVRKKQLPSSQAPTQPVMGVAQRAILKSSTGRDPMIRRRVSFKVPCESLPEAADGYPIDPLPELSYGTKGS